MGITRLTYCGPYVECKAQKTTSTYSERQCPNDTCAEHGRENIRDNFCSGCGTAIQEVPVDVIIDTVDPWELEQALGIGMSAFFFDPPHELTDQAIHIWVGEKANGDDACAGGPFWVCDDEQSWNEVRPSDIEAAVQQVAKDYRDELEHLRAAYGRDAVVVKWGVLHSVSC